MTATNSVGTGSAGSTVGSVTPATIPTPPTSVSASTGNATATVTWQLPASNGGSAITGYTVTPYVAGTPGTAQSVNGSTFTATFNGVRGNEWWVQASVASTGGTLAAVDARLNGGPWQPLARQSWGWPD